MTTHPDEGTILAYLDGELSMEEARVVRAHLAGCPGCREVEVELQGMGEVVAGALAPQGEAEDGEGFPTLDRAWARLQDRIVEDRRLEGAGGGEEEEGEDSLPGAPPSHDPSPGVIPMRGSRRRGAPLRVAASVLLAVGVGSSALPGSPVREWFTREFGGGGGAEGTALLDGGSTTGVSAPLSRDVGVFVPTEEGRLRVELAGMPEGTLIRVTFVDRSTAGVQAPEGTRFETGPGRVQAVTEGGRPAGEVRVEIPRGLREYSLWGNGVRYLSGDPEGAEVEEPVVQEGGDLLLFRVGG